MDYKVNLDVYNGPMDLLLYLIRRQEVDVRDIAISTIADEFAEYIDLLQAVDIDLAGEFLVMAATLVEMKSRELLPEPPPEEEEGEEDPREELVRQLLQYRRFKEAAVELDSRRRLQAQKVARMPTQIADDEAEELPLEQALKGIEVWDLVSAFAKVVKSLGYRKPREIVYDDTPIEEVAGEMLETIARAGSVLFADLFRRDLAKLHLITSFLALLELLRQRCVRTEPAEADDIRIVFVPENQRGDVPVRAEVRRPARTFKPAKSGKDPELKNILEDLAATQSTEFDEALKAIKVPDVILEHPVDETEAETDDADEVDDEPPTTSNRETETPHE